MTQTTHRHPRPGDNEVQNLQRQPNPAGRISTPRAPDTPASVQAVLRSPGQVIQAPIRRHMEQAFGADFAHVSLHTDAQAAASAAAINACAYTVGHHIVFANGQYAPHTHAGTRLLAHELAHVLQQAQPGGAPRLQRFYCPNTAPQAGGDFTGYHRDFSQCRLSPTPEAAGRYIPFLLDTIDDAQVLRLGAELTVEFSELGNQEAANTLADRVRTVWRRQFGTDITQLPEYSGLRPGNAAAVLIEQGRQRALADDHNTALRMFGTALMILKMQLRRWSQRANTALSHTDNDALPAGLNEAFFGLWQTTRIPTAEAIYEHIRDIVSFYPRLETAARFRGDTDSARVYSNMQFLLTREMDEEYAFEESDGDDEGTRVMMSYTRQARNRFGQTGYRIYGRNAATEIVTPLPGEPTPDELGQSPLYWQDVDAVVEAMADQEAFTAQLFMNPQIRAAFPAQRIDMNNPSERLRVWRIMYDIYETQTSAFPPLWSLLNLIETYFEAYTMHTRYNIRDFGVNYLTSTLPTDFAGRVLQDCGVYALSAAWDVFQVARTEHLNLAFEIFIMTDHATLVIFDRDNDGHYLVNNDQIEGPLYEDPLRSVARAYGAPSGLNYNVHPAVRSELGDTGQSESRFRAGAWRNYLNATEWSLTPEPRTGPADTRTEEERWADRYTHYYQDLRDFDRHAQLLTQALAELRRQLRSANNPRALLDPHIADLTAWGLALTQVFFRYGPGTADRGGALVGFTPQADRRRLQAIWLYAQNNLVDHPIVSLAKVLLYYEGIGGVLNAQQQALTQWPCMANAQGNPYLQDFCELIQDYERRGRPADF